MFDYGLASVSFRISTICTEHINIAYILTNCVPAVPSWKTLNCTPEAPAAVAALVEVWNNREINCVQQE